MTTVLMLLLGVVLTAGTFIFVSAEFSLVAVDQAVLDKKAEEGDRGAASVLRATRTLSTQLSGAQVGITLTTILLGYTTQSAPRRSPPGARCPCGRGPNSRSRPAPR